MTHSELCQLVPLRPIKDEDSLDMAISVVNMLTIKEQLTTDESDYFHVITMLIAEYEDKYWPIRNALGNEMLKHLMEENDDTPESLAKKVGYRLSDIQEILINPGTIKYRNLNWLEKIAKVYNVSVEVFL